MPLFDRQRLTATQANPIVNISLHLTMNPVPMADANYSALEQKLDRLIAACEGLQKENEQLKAFQADWLRERAVLKEKNEQIRQRVEAMITRLRTLEQDA